MSIRLSVAALAVATMALAAGASSAQAPSPRYARLFDAAWKGVDEGFYDPSFHGVDWKAVGDRYRARLGAVRDDAGFARLAGQMLGELKSSHLFISPPSTSNAAATGIGAEVSDGLVTEVALLSDAWRKGMRPGQTLIGPPEALRGELGSMAQVAVKACDGRVLKLSVRREKAFWPPAGPAFYWTRITTRAGWKVGYLRVDRFDDGAAGLIDQAMAELKGTQGLIIDVRANSGGNTSALRLASYFTGAEQPAIALFAQPYLKALGRPVSAADVARAPKVSGVYTDEGVFKAVGAGGGQAVFYTEDVGDKGYRGPVAVLIGADTGSAGEGFAWMMKLKTRARLIGRRTAGALLSSDSVDLGEGWKLTLPAQGLWGPDGQDFGDRPVQPDEALPRGRADLCSGRDRDLERAMEVVGGQA